MKFIPCTNDDMLKEDIKRMNKKKKYKQFPSKAHRNNNSRTKNK
jgi:hypothetical protein